MAEGKSISLEEIKKENVDLVSLCLYYLYKDLFDTGISFEKNQKGSHVGQALNII
jgi:hypothetical protein